MKRDPFADLVDLTETIYRIRLSGFRDVLEEERRLKEELRRLGTMQTQNEPSGAQNIPIQTLGADILWQGWLMRQRTELNIELANVLARKSDLGRQVRKAFGQAEVSRDLSRQSRRQAAGARQKRLDRE